MPGFDGTGPQGKGPMTGKAQGYCVFRNANGESTHLRGFAGAQGIPVDVELPEGKEVTDMPFGDGAGPIVSGPVVGGLARYPVPGYGNPVLVGGVPRLGMYGVAPYGYRRSWWGRAFWRPRFGRAFGRGRGRGRGCGRFGWWW